MRRTTGHRDVDPATGPAAARAGERSNPIPAREAAPDSLDSSPRVQAQRERWSRLGLPVQSKSAAHAQGVVQRMVIYSGENPPQDLRIIAGLPFAEAAVGGPSVHNSSQPPYHEHAQLAMLAHGSRGSIEWNGKSISGKQLAPTELAADKKRSVQPGTTVILWSCSAGQRSDEDTLDSVVDGVKAGLQEAGIAGVTVQGAKSTHIVAGTGTGEHFVPKNPVEQSFDLFKQIRGHYLVKTGFVSELLVAKLGNLVKSQPFVGQGQDQAYEYPADLVTLGQYLMNFKTLYEQESALDEKVKTMPYKTFFETRLQAFTQMVADIRNDPGFALIMDKVEVDWQTVKS